MWYIYCPHNIIYFLCSKYLVLSGVLGFGSNVIYYTTIENVKRYFKLYILTRGFSSTKIIHNWWKP